MFDRKRLKLLMVVVALAGPVSAQLNVVGPEEAAEGFVSLFDGTYESFHANFVRFRARNNGNTDLDPAWVLNADSGAMTNTAPAWDARSVRTYRDFDLRFDYRHPGDGGLFYRFTTDGLRAAETGMEWAMAEGGAGICNGCPGSTPPYYENTADAYRPYGSGLWNSVRLVVIKDSVEHWLNGEKVLGYRYHSEDFWKRVDGQTYIRRPNFTLRVPGRRDSGYIEEGYIGFQSQQDTGFLVRNIRINPTAPKFGPPTAVSIKGAVGKQAVRRLRVPQGIFLLPLPGGGSATADGRRFPIPRKP